MALSGCGGSGGRQALSGTVTLKGQPLADGTIEFVSEDRQHQSGGSIKQGKYSIPADQGVPAGKYKVRINSAASGIAAAGEAPGPESLQAAPKEEIPEEYNSNTQLTVVVEAGGRNEFPFDIP